MEELLNNIIRCEVCKSNLPFGPRPVVQLNPNSKIIIIGQAPGKRVHESGIPWDDASGKKLREWLGVDHKLFYDPAFFSILPMGFCYPGKGNSGDLPPRRECAPLWHHQFFSGLKTNPLVILVGQYAQRYYLNQQFRGSLTQTVKDYKDFLPGYFPLPHPSPRNQNWIKINPWFLEEAIPVLQNQVRKIING